MIVDSSALVAILRRESDAAVYLTALENAAIKHMATPTYLELCMVMAGNKPDEILNKVKDAMRKLGIVQLPFSQDMAEVAVHAFVTYGKGRHRAGLNFGDCMSYAASKVEAMPLLFKGDDFRHTDVECAL